MMHSSKRPPPKFRAPKKAAKTAAKSPKKSGREQHAHAQAPAQTAIDPETVRALHHELLQWFARAQRDLPWRRTRDPYAIWLSEVMLQQTRVETVIPYYERFLAKWPTVHALADAPIDDVLTMWSGLGYYRRARMLHAAAGEVARDRRGAFPASAEGLAEIKGIGRYTAGAIASIAFGTRAALVDGNVARVYARLFAIESDVRGGAGLARIWDIAEELVHDVDPGAWNQALMELGATICVPRDPRCLICPVRDRCRARALRLERELPRLAPKAKPKEELRWALVARAKDGVLLAQRRADLRFGGMWEPPHIAREAPLSPDDGGDAGGAASSAGEEEAIRALEALTGVRLRDVTRVGVVTHVLSHRRMELVVLRAELPAKPRFSPREMATGGSEYDRMAVVPESALDAHALSTLARKLLDAGV